MTDAELAHTKELAFWMTERVFMNPISAKFLNEDWRKVFPDEVAVAERMKALVEALEKAQQRIIELVARKEKRLPVPYAYLRESDGQIQISIGAERPSDRSGGYATPWFPIYTAAGIKVEAE
ncbi:hypothetical protein [Klebsiella quasipneumoniae]|uniref:hypothetical protein n=1 Tax=Klebsiella quasipneumoniae TaxID=1463165 RepID=UPI0010347376|nr:hypothetical protein [Klebsiella quasipneumoniae]